MREGTSPPPTSLLPPPEDSLPSTSAVDSRAAELDSPRRHGKLQRKGHESRSALAALPPTLLEREGSTTLEAFQQSLEDLRVSILQNIRTMNLRLEAQNRRLNALEKWKAEVEAQRNGLA